MPAPRRPKIEVLNLGRGWFWRFIGANGKTEAHAEIFDGGKGAAMKAARRFGARCNVRVMASDDRGETWVEDTPAEG